MNAEWFAERLRELRSEAGLTQEQLAERAGVKRDAVARWERGNREPSWSNVIALADALAVSTEAFRQEPGPAPTPQRGRPRKAPAEPLGPKRPRGRPRKEQGVQLNLLATESAPLGCAPGPTPTTKGRAGKLPELQEKPRKRKARRPRGG
jgi:transcriptional regulator with XRE-family HTH domain